MAMCYSYVNEIFVGKLAYEIRTWIETPDIFFASSSTKHQIDFHLLSRYSVVLYFCQEHLDRSVIEWFVFQVQNMHWHRLCKFRFHSDVTWIQQIGVKFEIDSSIIWLQFPDIAPPLTHSYTSTQDFTDCSYTLLIVKISCW